MFTEFAELIALDFGIPTNSEDELSRVWDRMTELFRTKGDLVKSGRWFSWHTSADSQMWQWWALRMLLSHLHPDVQPDDSKTFGQLRESLGGLRLGLQCMTWHTFFGIKVLQLGGAPLWKWYSTRVQSIKSPQQHLKHLIELTMDNRWTKDSQFMDLATVLTDWNGLADVLKYHQVSRKKLDRQQHGELMESFVMQLWYYILNLMAKRSVAICKFSTCPDVYAGLLSSNQEDAQNCWEKMLEDWKLLVLLEQSRYQDLVSDLQLTVDAPCRLAYQMAELGRREQSLRLMRAMLLVLPDTKFVEDLHQKVKLDGKFGKRNSKQTCSCVQSLIENSGMLESRGIPHTARLDREAFVNQWKTAKGNLSWKVVP